MYRCLVNKIFKVEVGQNVEVYFDDMLVNSKALDEHQVSLKETFEVLRKYNMQLNPLKCAFGMAFGKLLGFILNHRGIEENRQDQGLR